MYGKLVDFDDNILRIEVDKQITDIDRNDVALIKTVYNWDRKE